LETKRAVPAMESAAEGTVPSYVHAAASGTIQARTKTIKMATSATTISGWT
jgi:hypothetical protein